MCNGFDTISFKGSSQMIYAIVSNGNVIYRDRDRNNIIQQTDVP